MLSMFLADRESLTRFHHRQIAANGRHSLQMVEALAKLKPAKLTVVVSPGGRICGVPHARYPSGTRGAL